MSKIITTAEVKKHNSKNSLWMIIHNDVYNVTQFLDEHPGGEESLLDMAGREATQAFEDVGHSDDARELMKKYKIGTLPDNEHSQEPVIVPCCPSIPPNVLKNDDKTWRTYDGSPARSRTSSKTEQPVRFDFEPTQSNHVQSILVPTEPRTSESNWKLYLALALLGAIAIGVIVKMKMGS